VIGGVYLCGGHGCQCAYLPIDKKEGGGKEREKGKEHACDVIRLDRRCMSFLRNFYEGGRKGGEEKKREESTSDPLFSRGEEKKRKGLRGERTRYK